MSVAVCCSVIQCVTVCCSVLQCVADTQCLLHVFCLFVTATARLQHTSAHCNKLQHTATHCNTLQHPATQDTLKHCNTLQHTATHCNTLQHTANTLPQGDYKQDLYNTPINNTLQHTATHCNALHCNTLQQGDYKQDLHDTPIVVEGHSSFTTPPLCVTLRCCGTWLIYMWDMTHLCVGHDPFICGTWLIRAMDRAVLYTWHDSSICVQSLIFVFGDIFIHECDMHFKCDRSFPPPLICHVQDMCAMAYVYELDDQSYVWRDSFICVTWLIHVCGGSNFICVKCCIRVCDISHSFLVSSVFKKKLNIYFRVRIQKK